MHASGEHILFQDADGASKLEDLELLQNVIKSGGVAIGSRAHLVSTNAVVKVNNLLLGFFQAHILQAVPFA
jgi:hypothetical protein